MSSQRAKTAGTARTARTPRRRGHSSPEGPVAKMLAVMVAGLVVCGWAMGAEVGTEVVVNTRHFLGTTNNAPVTVALLSQQPFTSGSNFVFGTPRTLQPTNSICTVRLLPASYTLTLAGSQAVVINVPDSTNSYNAIDLVVRGVTPVLTIVSNTYNSVFQTNLTILGLNDLSTNTQEIQLAGDAESLGAITDTNRVRFFWVDLLGVSHGNAGGMTNVPGAKITGTVPTTALSGITSNSIAPETDAAYRAVGSGGSADSPTNHDSREFVMEGPWTFNGGITAPGLAGFSITASNATSDGTATPIWTNTVTVNTTIKFGNISITGTGPTNSYGGSVLNAVFRRGAGSVEFVGSNVLESASGGLTAVFTTNGTSDQVVLVVTGHANENVNWYAQGFYKVLTNGLPAAPVISDVASSVTASNATITWTTDVAANSTVNWGLTSGFGSSSNTADQVTSHSVTIGGLSDATTYYYMVSSTNGLGLSDVDGDYSFVTTSGVDSDQLYTNLAAYWNLDEASGTRYAQVGGSISLGQSGATLYSTTGIDGNAANNFLGVSSFLSRADNAAYSFTNGSSWTIAAWVKPNSSNLNQAVINKTDTGAYEYYIRGFTSGTWQFTVYTNLSSSTSWVTVDGPPIVTNAWHLLVAWQDWSAGTLNLQVDGGTVYSTNCMGGVNDGTGTFRIGRNTSTAYFDGAIDEVAIWKTALSSGLRGLLWTSGTGAFYPY